MTAAAPGTSNVRPASRDRDSGTNLAVAKVRATPTGTFTKKIHRHEAASVRTPPSRSPMAPPPAEIALQIANALARSFSSLKLVVMIDNTAGASRAPPSPCRPRPAISIAGDWAKPLSSDAVVKSTIPAPKTRLRPMTSPARPPKSMKPPKMRVYVVITHCRFDGLKPQTALDGRQRHVDDRRVQDDHGLGNADDNDYQPRRLLSVSRELGPFTAPQL